MSGTGDWTRDNYYERLGVEKTADSQQLKRAYFGLVRRYPPERFPEEFKAVREAYETLSHPEGRAEYDKKTDLPKIAQPVLRAALEERDQGKLPKAVSRLKTLVDLFPDILFLREELAVTYEMMDKNGTAMKIWEKLAQLRPDSSRYALELARSYDHRGWGNKALAEYRRAIEADRSNLDAWSELMMFHDMRREFPQTLEVCPQALAAAREAGVVNSYIYTMAFIKAGKTDQDRDEAGNLLDELVQAANRGAFDAPELESVARLLLEVVLRLNWPEFFPKVRELTETILQPNEEIRELLEHGAVAWETSRLEEEGYPDLLRDLLLFLYAGDDAPDFGGADAAVNRNALEFHLLADRDAYRTPLLRLKEEHPGLYRLHEGFFNEALRTRDPEKMLHQRAKFLSKHGFSPFIGEEDGEEEEEVTPVQQVRAGPKVGRNDPCPCGSGKKYKKCCGAS